MSSTCSSWLLEDTLVPANASPDRQSALTDFLASQNISARNIAEQHQQRLQQAQAQAAQDDQDAATNAVPVDPTQNDQDLAQALGQEELEASSNKKRKRGKEPAKDKASAKKKKKAKKGDDESDADFDLNAEMYKKSKPNPGQLDNCEICEKRFTVTAYSKTGPDGGLVCNPCGKTLKPETGNAGTAAKKAGTGRRRRQAESNRLDGMVNFGPKSLNQLCIEKVVQHHNDVEELGELPDALLHRLAEIFGKKRVLTPNTLPLFLRSDLHEVVINDAAYLDAEDFKRIFAEVAGIRKVVLRNAGQFKNDVVEYMSDRARNLKFLQIYGANLVSDECWIMLFKTIGRQLETIKLQWMDAAFNDQVVSAMVEHCPNLKCIKLKMCRQLTPDCLSAISRLSKLEHLSMQLSISPSAEQITHLLRTLAPSLETLSLENFYEMNDDVLAVIRDNCSKLQKLRLTDLDGVTDTAFHLLFNTQDLPLEGGGTAPVTKLPPLRFVDLTACRDVDNNNPDGPTDDPVGLGIRSFPALMSHSGKSLEILRIPSCRHISSEALADAFCPSKRVGFYRNLKEINLSFVPRVDTGVVQSLFACCPKLTRCIAFGCFSIEEVVVPRAVALIGVPRAQDAIEKVGDWNADIQGRNLDASYLDQLGGMAPSMVGIVSA